MIVLYIILLAIVQGITEFLPVSSFGHLCFVQNILGMEHGPGVLMEVMLHLGTLAAVFMTFQKDIRRLAVESIEMFITARQPRLYAFPPFSAPQPAFSSQSFFLCRWH